MLQQEDGCPRCASMVTRRRNTRKSVKKGKLKESTTACDVGIKAVFRGIRRCAIAELSSFSVQELTALATRQFGSDAKTLDVELAKETAQLIKAFKMSSSKAYEPDASSTSQDVELCALAQKVCFYWNRSAHMELVSKDAFSTMLNLRQFSTENILARIEKGVKQCRST